MDELASVLQRERRQLEVVVFKYATAHLLLAAAEVRFLTWSADEANLARDRVRETDLLRAAHAQLLGLRGSRGGAPTLREIAAASAKPWASILRDHHEALCALVSEIELLGHMNSELARAGMRSIAEGRDPLAAGGNGAGRRRRGAKAARATSAVLDEARLAQPELSLLEAESSYEDVLRSMNRLRMPSLLAFLR